tara:strand:+ start:218 stop:979 length:762 start_codon:yes stop_codon:yes gene_type:complete
MIDPGFHFKRDLSDFEQRGFVDLGVILTGDDLKRFQDLYQNDGKTYSYFWHPYGHHQTANYDALVTSPEFDSLIRHPLIYPRIENLMGGPLCFGEIGLRRMGRYEGEFHQEWHRDRAHYTEHPLRLDYIQLMVYLTDVDETTHCISMSPESVEEPVLRDDGEQLKRGVFNLHGPAGTCALFNASILHTATTRSTDVTRKTVQIYYGHRDRPPLANDSAVPASLWRDHDDAETRAFYGVLNERTRIMMDAFGQS